MNEQKRAALALHTAADLLNTASTLIALEETTEALRQLATVRAALSAAAEAADATVLSWDELADELADVLDTALTPTLAPGEPLALAAFRVWQEQLDPTSAADPSSTHPSSADRELN